MNKRAKKAKQEARTTIAGSSSFQFRVNYEQSKAVDSDVVSVGGHLWRIKCFPRGPSEIETGEYISLFFIHMGKSRSFRAIVHAFVMGRGGRPSGVQKTCRTLDIHGEKGCTDIWGWYQFVEVTDVEKNFLTEGHFTFVCTIIVMDDTPIPVPPSDIGTHLGHLLDRTDGTEAFIVDNETFPFPAHRAVLAARSPVFRAELLGSMAEATMSSITLYDITPAAFKVMLGFIYTDELPAEDELEDSSAEMFQNLLAAADRYALDRLKFICAQKLWDEVSIDTIAIILACAETYNCQELKNKCIDFTDGYAPLVMKFPSIAAELKKRIRA